MEDEHKGAVLVVDDTPANLGVLFAQLEHANFKVLVAEDGISALRSVERIKPDIILLDVRLPDIDGFELCRRLHNKPDMGDIPIIFLSVLVDTADKLKGLGLHAVDYITKPFEAAEVVARIEKHLIVRNLQKRLSKQNRQLQQEIIERKQIETELLIAKEQAEKANRAKSHFLANMSHELRTPLSVILGFTQLMARHSNLTVQQKEQLSTISRSGEHLLGLINDILELSKIEAGQSVLQTENLDLHGMLIDLDEMFRLHAEAKGLALIFEQAPDLPEHVRMDGRKVRQVLINLLSNAVKFTQKGYVTVRVSGDTTVEPASLWLQFEVSDSGIGIAPEELDAVFEAFVQTSSGQKSQKGTGLGMSISRAFVEMMGGSLSLTSEVGVGTTCRFDVPAEPITASYQQTRQVIGLQPNQYAPDGGPYRLLVAEDKAANRQLLIRLLESLGQPPQGVEIREAVNGKEAIEIWRQWSPHLIWMDMRMPVMDGLEATRQIKAIAQGKETIIVALTALAFSEDEERMLAAGCDDYVRKPFREEDIFSALAKHLNLAFIYDSTDGLNKLDKIKTTSDDCEQAQETDITSLLATMPAQWLDNLREEAFIGDLSGMMALVTQIGQIGHSNYLDNKYLADKLTDLINNFKWDEILMLIPKKEEG